MIVSRPKINTLFSLGLFLVIFGGLSIYFFNRYLSQGSNESTWIGFAAAATGGIAMGIIVKTLLDYKVLRAGKERLEVNYPFRFKQKKYPIKQVVQWKVNKIKTFSAPFLELRVLMEDKKIIKLSNQENSEFKGVVGYLEKKAGKKQKK